MAVAIPTPVGSREMCLTHETVRQFIWDRTLNDNPLDLDLAFSDDEIGSARRMSVMMFNSVPPYVVTIQANELPTNCEYPILMAIAYHLMLGKVMTLQRKDIDYSAGNMTVDTTKRRIEHHLKWAQLFKAEAEAKIKEFKVAANLESGYASF
jgi:hypothetical protein